MTISLRPYQESGVAELRDKYRAGAKACLYVAPTGSGKTVLFTHVAQGVVRNNRRAWILVHRQELLSQTSRALEWLGIEHGVVAPGFTPMKTPVQVASVQTLVRRVSSMADVDLIVIDEAHHSTAGSWRKVIEARPGARLLGVTATPLRLDGQGLGVKGGGVFDEIVVGPSVRELIAGGYLAQPVVYAPPQILDMAGVKMRGGDFAANEMAAAVDRPTITGDAVEHYKRICSGAPAIVFCASVLHAEHVAATFRAAGYRAESIDGNMQDARRKRLIAGLADGSIQVLTSCEIISEGLDIPHVEAAILLRPTASLGLYMQQVGRALRPAPGKSRAVILDHVGNCLRHGLPDDDREWSLAGRVKSAGTGKDGPPIAVRQCPQCFAAHRPAPACPVCGHVYEPMFIPPEQEDGELIEITPDAAEQLRRAKYHEVVAQARTREELERIAKARGYKKEWINHVLEAKRRARERIRGAA